MKKVIMIVGMVLTTSLVFTQNTKKVEKLAEKMAVEICGCMSVETDFEAFDDTMEVFMECFMSTLNENQNEVEKRVLKRKSGYAKMEAMQDFSVSVGIYLGLNCEQFLNFATKNANGFNDSNKKVSEYGTY
jgi:hypothetical protein